eukprot:TRINITY_DN17323_c0_g1_i1.p2 TRINITY_DN17323_c0_g1~~TRINITY_DN17323_c0_g1_i1.p2  ORF type:complete len:139 (+),score=33.39 TRINITY_DN17323_c0_g1_i1:1734-2150(+)
MSVVESRAVKVVYLAVSPLYYDEFVLSEFERTFQEAGVRLYRGAELESIRAIEDNYYTSLVEQEICSSSKFFLASGSSTWSDFIQDEHRERKKANMDMKLEIETFNGLLLTNNMPYTTWNREAQEEKLKNRRRPQKRG